jgi:hypothetical protein
MPRGGARPNSGPKKGSIRPTTINKLQAREALREVVIAHMGELLAAQIAHAKGIKYLMARSKKGGKFERVSEAQLDSILKGQDDGSIVLEVWDKDPSVQAFTDLLNRALDKPSEHVEVTGAEGGPLLIQWQG